MTVVNLNDPLMTDTIQSVRLFLRDFEALNRITKGLDHNDRHIGWSVLDTLSDWSSTPPFVFDGSLATIVRQNWNHVFIRGVAISLLESLMFLHLRNFISYSQGGINVQTENPQMLQATLQLMKSEYEEKKRRIITAHNIAGALDSGPGVHSSYLFVNSFWGRY